MNKESIIIAAFLAVLVIVAVIFLIRRKKKGKSLTCGGNCEGCAYHCGDGKTERK